mgnify:CR=1 FL=1
MQLVVNAAWTPIFFGMEQIGAALIVIVLLDLLVGALIYTTIRVSAKAAWCLAPYLAWICFATILNTALFFLN